MSNRRDFLKKAGGLALLTIVPRSVLGGTKFVAPSDQLTKGIIGVGGIGKSSYHFTSNDACRLVAVCDVDRKHLESAIALGRKKFDKTLESYHDYRDLITDPNVDIVQSPRRRTGTASWPSRRPRPARTSGARNR
jgi:Predicted dehydrogenases and related proteins